MCIQCFFEASLVLLEFFPQVGLEDGDVFSSCVSWIQRNEVLFFQTLVALDHEPEDRKRMYCQIQQTNI